MTRDMDDQKHSSCKVSSKCSGPGSKKPGCFALKGRSKEASNPPQNVTESSVITQEIGRLSKKISIEIII
jgi:hypothetical protein